MSRAVVRWVLAGLAGAALLAITIYAIAQYVTVERTRIANRLYDDPAKEAIKIRLDSSKDLFQVGLLIAGGVWALYLGKTEESGVDLKGGPEVAMFVACNAAFIFSFLVYYGYTDRVSTSIYYGVHKGQEIYIPDVFRSPRIEILPFCQRLFFATGAIIALAAFLSGRYLRR